MSALTKVQQAAELTEHSSNRSNASNNTAPGLVRVLDACMNRAREGFRVLEDYARFILDDRLLVQNLKDLRHHMAASERDVLEICSKHHFSESMVTERDIEGDVGTNSTGSQELVRSQIPDIVHANARRVQESLRSLEEFGKLISVPFAAEMKQLRYQAYTIHQQMLSALNTRGDSVSHPRQRLLAVRVCVLVTEAGCRHSWKQVIETCLEGGAGMIQLREKHLEDRELLTRSRWMVDACHSADALCLINDRPDIAYLSGADGVHLGQNDCSIGDARHLLGPDRLIGLSTHNVEDTGSSDAHIADYLGIGPVFPSATKEFNCIAGLDLLSKTTDMKKPWFAIGGIDQENITQVVNAGARRIAVSSTVIAADRPDQVVQMLHKHLSTG